MVQSMFSARARGIGIDADHGSLRTMGRVQGSVPGIHESTGSTTWSGDTANAPCSNVEMSREPRSIAGTLFGGDLQRACVDVTLRS